MGEPGATNNEEVLVMQFDDITKTCLFKYIESCTSKNRKFSDKKTEIFFIFLLKT